LERDLFTEATSPSINGFPINTPVDIHSKGSWKEIDFVDNHESPSELHESKRKNNLAFISQVCLYQQKQHLPGPPPDFEETIADDAKPAITSQTIPILKQLDQHKIGKF